MSKGVKATVRRKPPGRPATLSPPNSEPNIDHLSASRDTENSARRRQGRRHVDHTLTLTETQWHYVTIGYGHHLLGLLVETEDEDIARSEAEEVCTGLYGHARVLEVRKVVIQ